MSRLMRMAYGHGGTRLERTLVSRHHQGPAPVPLRLKLFLLAAWITVPALVSLFAIPKTSLPMKTVIDISRLSVKPPPEPGKLIMPEPKPAPAVELNPEPPPQAPAAPEQAVEPPRVRQTPTPQVEEIKRPSIARTAPADLPDLTEQKLQTARERRRIEAETDASPAARLRRGSLPADAASERAALSRARSAAVPEEPATRERTAVVRRQTAADSSVAAGPPPQRAVRSERPYAPPEESTPRSGAARERASAGGGGDQTGAAAGVTRGVSLMSLEICSSSQQQEAAIKAVLAVVGTRQSCRNEKGEYQFRGTKRISSFNLMIYPSKGRRLSNRCEELEDAYQCLKNN